MSILKLLIDLPPFIQVKGTYRKYKTNEIIGKGIYKTFNFVINNEYSKSVSICYEMEDKDCYKSSKENNASFVMLYDNIKSDKELKDALNWLKKQINENKNIKI